MRTKADFGRAASSSYELDTDPNQFADGEVLVRRLGRRPTLPLYEFSLPEFLKGGVIN